MSVVPPDVYRHAAAQYQAGSGESGSEALGRRSAGCMASPYVAETGNSGQRKRNYLQAAGPNGSGIMHGDSVAAVADARGNPRHLQQGIAGCRADVGVSVGRLRGVEGGVYRLVAIKITA